MLEKVYKQAHINKLLKKKTKVVCLLDLITTLGGGVEGPFP